MRARYYVKQMLGPLFTKRIMRWKFWGLLAGGQKPNFQSGVLFRHCSNIKDFSARPLVLVTTKA